jgi:hypothetical protein
MQSRGVILISLTSNSFTSPFSYRLRPASTPGLRVIVPLAMSKPSFNSSIPTDDPIPSYEEALAASIAPSFRADAHRRTSSTTPSISQERTRRIFGTVTDTILPCVATHVSNLCNHITVVLVPAGSLPVSSSSTITAQNIVTPSLQSPRTACNVLTLIGEENRPSFWTQQTVVTELDRILRSELSRPTLSPLEPPPKFEAVDEIKSPPPALPPLQVQPAPGTQLPPRPSKQSWLKRTFVLPGEDHDPTGDTGKWNLGWRSPTEPSEGSADQYGWTAKPIPSRTEKLQPDEVAVDTQLRDVSFRTENEMGLLESTTVKCIWIEVEVGI